jgi:hypothetical protein
LSPLAIEADGSVHPRFTTSAVETFAEVAEGLAAAHARAVRHRRLTPRNLIFTPAGRLLVTDFGGDAATAGDGLAYRAPEELGPFPERAGPEADVYALGVILYEVLTRRSPFTAASPAELKRAIVKGRFPVPRSFRAEVPAALEAIVLKAMARRPEDRYRNAGELAADLRRFLRHETPLAIREARLSSRPGDRGERGDDRCEVPAAGDSPAPPTAARSRFRSLAGSGGARRRAATAAALVLSLATAAWWVSSHVLGPAREADPVLSFNPGSAGAPRAAGRAPATSSPAREEAALIRRPEPAATPPAANPLGIQSSFIDGLLAVSGTGTPALTGAAFAALVDETERVSARDPAAVQALCRWDLELVAALDLAPRPASVMVPPGMRVELEAGDPGDFTARWVRTRSRIDPGALGTPELLAAFAGGALPASFDDLDEEEALDRRTSVLRELLAGLVRAGGAGARQAAAVIARDHYLTNGKDALSALVALAAHEELAALARGSLPLPLREAALVLVGERFAGLAAGELRSIAVASPEASLRRAAFHALAELADANAVALLPRLLDDPDLRGEASAVLAAFPAGALGPIALDLLDHGDGAVRSRGVDAAAASGEELVRPLALRLLSPRWAVREAAFAALARRGDLPRVAEALSVVLGRPGPPPHPSPLPPPDAGALARAADAPGG